MSIAGRIFLRLLPSVERNHILSYVPERDRRYLVKILKGRAVYPKAFDRTRSVFIHIPKTAGRSLVKGLYGLNSVEHAGAEWYQRIDALRFESYFKFAFVRNPWDRMVSAWSYLSQGGAPSSAEDTQWGAFVRTFDSFDDFVCRWVNEDSIRRKHLLTPQSFFVVDRFGAMAMDFVGRYESLRQDYERICIQLGIESTLPHLNRSERQHYTELYTDRSRGIIARVYRKDIEMFGYSFGS